MLLCHLKNIYECLTLSNIHVELRSFTHPDPCMHVPYLGSVCPQLGMTLQKVFVLAHHAEMLRPFVLKVLVLRHHL